MSHIFVSYSRKDIAFADEIVRALAEEKLDTWIDWKSIPKGEEWEQEIYRGIEEADAFLFLISPDSVRSQICNKEIAHAVKNGKRILPILIRDTEQEVIPADLAKLNWIFCRDERDDFKKAIKEIRETVNTDYDWLRFHTELLVKALKWEKRNFEASLLIRGKELDETESLLAMKAGIEPYPVELQRKFVLGSRQAINRQRRSLTYFSIGIAIIMFGLAISAVIFGVESQRQARIALARQWAAQGQLIFEDNPLLGLRLGLEAWSLVPESEVDTRDFIFDAIRSMAMSGRIMKFGDDIESIYSDPDGSIIILDHANLPGEVRRTNDGMLVTTLTDKIQSTPQSSYPGVFFTPDKNANYFIVNYMNAPDELRRTIDGSLVSTLTSEVGGVYFSSDSKASYFVIFSDGSRELYRTSDGTLITSLKDTAFNIEFSPDTNATALIVTYENAPAELRRTTDGSLITLLKDKAEFKGLEERVSFSPNPEATYLVVNYDGAAGELRRTTDGVLITTLTGDLDNYSRAADFFSPDKGSSFFIADYDNLPGELRRTADGAIISTLADEVGIAYYSPDPKASYVLIYYANHVIEVRRTIDGQIIKALSGELNSFDFISNPSAAYFVINYKDAAPELRRTVDGGMIPFPYKIDNIIFERSAISEIFIVDYENKPGELRSASDGTNITKLAGEVDNVFFSQDRAATYFVVNYTNAPTELRRSADGKLVTKLAGKVNRVEFNSDLNTNFFIAYYWGISPEMYNTIDGTLIASFPTAYNIEFSPDSNVNYLMVKDFDNQHFLWGNQNGFRALSNLGLGGVKYIFDQDGHRLTYEYGDGRAYLMDLDWLKAMGGEIMALSPENLVKIICDVPLLTQINLEEDLLKFLGDNELRACH